MRDRIGFGKPPRGPVCARAVGLLAVLLTASCAQTGRNVASWGSITVAPGDTGNCWSSPCSVYLQMPPGEGRYRVTASQVEVGAYPAGHTVLLGGFYESKAIRIPEADVPPAYVYVPNVR